MTSGTVTIVTKPIHAVKNLKKPTIKTSSDYTAFTVTWDYPSGAFDKSNPSRFQGVGVKWSIGESGEWSGSGAGRAKISSSTIYQPVPKSKSYKDSNGNTIIYYTTQETKLSTRMANVGFGYNAVRFYNGSDVKSSTYRIKRKDYYPFVTNDSRFTNKRVKCYYVSGIQWGVSSTPTITYRLSDTSFELRTLAEKINLGDIATKAGMQQTITTYFKQWGVRLGINDYLYYGSKYGFNWITNVPVVASSTPSKSELVINSNYSINYYLNGIGATVQGWNKMSLPAAPGTGYAEWSTAKKNVKWDDYGVPSSAQVLNFELPLQPSITKMAIEGSSSNLTNKIHVAVDARCNRTSIHERSRTMIEVYMNSRQYNFSKKIYTHTLSKKVTYTALDKTSKYKYGEKFEFYINPDAFLTDQQGYKRTVASMLMDESLIFEVTAVNQGFCGDSPMASKKFTIAYPHSTVIKRITQQGQHYHIDFTVSGDNGVVQRRNTKSFTLQRVSNYMPNEEHVEDWSDAKWLSYLKNDNSVNWSEVVTLPSSTRSFSDNIYDAKPAGYTRTFYRIRANKAIDSLSHVYSQPFALPFFNRMPTAKNELATILAIHSTEDGNGLQVVANFTKTKNNQGVFNSNGTELSWDESSYAWKSNTPPSSYDYYDNVTGFSMVTYDLKNSNKTIGATTYKKLLAKAEFGTYIATYYISGLQSLTEYYVKARRFMKDKDKKQTESYGKYASYQKDGTIATVAPSKRPTDVKLSAPDEVVYGKDFSVSWEYESDAEQAMYSVMWHQGDNEAAIEQAKTLLSKKEKANYAVIPWNSVKDKFFDDTLYLSVKIRTVHYWSKIEEITKIKLVRPPKAALGVIPNVTQKPIKIALYTNKAAVSAVVRIRSNGVTTWGPEGRYTQPDGAIIYSDKIKPNWTKIEAKSLDAVGKSVQYVTTDPVYVHNLQIENGRFVNGSSYTIEYHVVDDENNMTSVVTDSDGIEKRCTRTFSIDYSNGLVRPSGYVTLSSTNVTHMGHDAEARISVYLDPSYTGSEREYFLEKCALSIYRVTPDGVTKIASNLAPWSGRTFVDPYPAYSKDRICSYRIALTNDNGEVEWRDLEYRYPGYSVRFDWGSSDDEKSGEYTHLVLPYNLTWSDQWTKNSRIETHMDGSVTGHWRSGVSRSNSLSTELARIEGAEQCDRVRALAKYAGPVLVRLPDGCCFTADVSVSNFENAYDKEVLSVSFTAKQIDGVSNFDIDNTTSLPGVMAPQTYEHKVTSWYKTIANGNAS